MKKNSHITRIVLYQNIGFTGILILSYLNDRWRLPPLGLSGHPFMFMHSRMIFELLLVLAVWFLVATSTRRILQRIRYLENFMRVCSWCRRIHYQGEWMPLEKFMRQGFDTPTTHGICLDCYHQQQAAIANAKRMRKDSSTSKES